MVKNNCNTRCSVEEIELQSIMLSTGKSCRKPVWGVESNKLNYPSLHFLKFTGFALIDESLIEGKLNITLKQLHFSEVAHALKVLRLQRELTLIAIGL